MQLGTRPVGGVATTTATSGRPVIEVARELLYKADRGAWDGVVDSADVPWNGKLARALLDLTGRDRLELDDLATLAGRFADTSGAVDSAGFERLSAAIGAITRTLPTRNDGRRTDPTFDGIVRYLVGHSDVDYDGVLGPHDAQLGSDMAQVLFLLTGRTQLDRASLAQAMVAYGDGTPAQNVEAFTSTVLAELREMTSRSSSVGDFARSGASQFDSDQDLRLTPADGAMARRILAKAGRDSMVEADVVAWYDRFDTRGADGAPGRDGRLDQVETRDLFG